MLKIEDWDEKAFNLKHASTFSDMNLNHVARAIKTFKDRRALSDSNKNSHKRNDIFNMDVWI